MHVIPAIDILEGHCVRLYQGDYQQSQVYDRSPVDVARKWAEQGATRLHIVDLDGAKVGTPQNQNAIAAIAEAVSIPVQVGGGLRSFDSVAEVMQLGVQQAILGTTAVEQPETIRNLCQEFPNRIAVGIDARNGKVATKGWLETSEILATDLALQMAKLGVATIIYTDIYRDGTLTGPNIESLREIANCVDVPIIASGGIRSVTDLLNLLTLEPYGVAGAIIGRALYTGDVVLSEALQAVGPGRIQDVPPGIGNMDLA